VEHWPCPKVPAKNKKKKEFWRMIYNGLARTQKAGAWTDKVGQNPDSST
jgi:hypothetical protein